MPIVMPVGLLLKPSGSSGSPHVAAMASSPERTASGPTAGLAASTLSAVAVDVNADVDTATIG